MLMPACNGIARIVAGAIRDDAGVARVILFNLENDLHQIGADVGDLGEDTARDAQRRRAQRFADGETDETRTRVVARNEEQDAQHDEQLHADQQHADAHAGLERNRIAGVRLPAQTGKCRSRIGKRVNADAEPGNAEAARNADQAERENNQYLRPRQTKSRAVRSQEPKIKYDNRAYEGFEDQQKLALRQQISLAGFVDKLGDFEHRFMHR